MDELPTFRAPKRRKFAKSVTAERPASAPPLAQADNARSDVDLSSSSNDEDTVQTQTRKPFRPSKLGVSFTSNAPTQREESNGLAVMAVDNTSDRLRQMTDRFIGTTGQVVDVDKHMMAYIDSELARKRQPGISPGLNDTPEPLSNANTSTLPSSTLIQTTKEPQQQHQLSEVALPPTAPPAPPPPKRTRKPRLGRDGKPMRPRRPKRRNSDDLARDALVEQVLHEHRLDHYQPQPPPPSQPPASSHKSLDSNIASASDHPESTNATATATSATATSNSEADEAFALRFQREFEEGLAERQAMQRKPQKKKDGKEEEKKDRGPRLGGSRSARAKMHEKMREAEGKGRGGGGAGGGAGGGR